MRGIRILLCLVFTLGQTQMFTPYAHAQNVNGVVISQMYAGTSSGELAKQEFIELYNNSDTSVNVTDWCVNYIPYTGNLDSEVELACLASPDTDIQLLLPSHGRAVFVSNELDQAIPTSADEYFDGGIYQVKGYVRIMNSQKEEIDRLGWGLVNDDTYPSANKPVNGNALQRIINDDVMQDTNSDNNDFVEIDVIEIHSSAVYEEQIVIDECPNLIEHDSLPIGYLVDEYGDCQPDSCLNIDGLQVSVPNGYESDDSGYCTQSDECDNLPNVQEEIPKHMVRGDGNTCVIKHSSLKLTEILPNAIGIDNGNEFIEIFNSGGSVIDLTYYSIKVGVNTDKVYTFPIGSTIGPGEYRMFSDSQMKFTLVNTSGRVALVAEGGAVFGDTGIYESANEGEGWALIENKWEYTNRPTPGEANLSSILEAKDDNTTSPSTLKPCNDDQFRNPETNRCKKIESSTLTPCSEGQTRNPETNRCRKVTSASTSLKPCQSNQYRSPETNRCRKKEISSIPEAKYKVQTEADSDMVFAGWWALGGVGALASGYAGWEWRRELIDLWGRLKGLLKI